MLCNVQIKTAIYLRLPDVAGTDDTVAWSHQNAHSLWVGVKWSHHLGRQLRVFLQIQASCHHTVQQPPCLLVIQRS
jgi:hypothetical protein